ncbi:cell division protein FtsZ [Candidatus Falkowbacteria bacterium CG10_big_fil_rev_8_21_14_0_10_39_11]|uniref:Cell division protein FtsZ n=1 Tax=Candidatus Falkowbacteria bacterium CG10_big_fil_rev_8_21_14_0_10_39_11 TaxID=1974565 RepID=A0A2H0V568_9BACT|nr:MAG: cell division protein FtsZ [Candidatus Falkowbacteria bacterium CG10_big_fil_rev_8_21_14_0_10_39_11]
MPEIKPEIETFAKIKVIGVGGGGGSAVNRMIENGVKGVEFVAVNTDLQALQNSAADYKVHIGRTTTRGLGAGMDPGLGRKSAEESQNEIRELLKGTDLLFITCGLGGGTGSGASPVVAEISKEMGILTIAVVTKPFSFEGGPRRRIAEESLENLSQKVDTLITIPNDRIWQLIDKKTPLIDAFKVVDEVLRQGVQGISELITLPGLINVDFADVKAIMKSSGSALMGMGIASGDNRAIEAAKGAVSSPLLEISVEGAKGILFTIAGGESLTMYEVSEAAKVITDSVDADAKIIFGAVHNDKLQDEIKITVVATGFDEKVAKDNILKVSNEPINYFQAKSSSPEIKEEKKEEVKVADNASQMVNNFMSNATQASQGQQQIQEEVRSEGPRKTSESGSNDDELDIPAFIRKKMM